MTEFPSMDRFRSWLARKPQGEVLASQWDWETCPLCLFLIDHGSVEPNISNREWSDAYGEPANLPNWAREFVYWIDKIKPRSVTPEEILFVMDLPSFKPSRWIDPPFALRY